MPVPYPSPEQACGARTRAGAPCNNWPVRTSTSVRRRCRMHGGASLTGMAHPGWQHGLYSRGLRELFKGVRIAAELNFHAMLALRIWIRIKKRELYAVLEAIEHARLEALPDEDARLRYLLGQDDVPM